MKIANNHNPTGFSRTITLSVSITAFFAVAGLIAYIPGLRALGSIRLDYIPMAPSTACCFLIFSTVNYCYAKKHWGTRFLPTRITMVLLVTLFCLLGFAGELIGMDLNYEKHLFSEIGKLGQIPVGLMSPVTSAVFIVAGIGSLLLLSISKNSSPVITGHLASISGFLTILAGSTVLLAYVYGTPFLYGTAYIPMAATTAICFLFLGLSLVVAAGPESFPLCLVMGNTTSVKLSRVFIPLTILFVLIQSILSNILSTSSMVNHALFLAILVAIFGIITAFTISRFAHSTGHSIDKLNMELQQNAEWYRTVLKTAMDGFWVVDTKGQILEVNDTYCRMTGYSANELFAINISNVEAMETMDDIVTRIKMIMVRGEDRFETRHRRKDGSTFDVEVSVQYHPIDGGRFIAFLRDISERKHAEEKSKKLQDQLNQAQRMEYVGRLAGGVAHDFNNMLSVIIGFTEMVLDKVEHGSTIHEDLLEVLNAAERSTDLTRQLLAFARKQTVTPKILDLNETVEGMLKMMRRLIGENIDLAWLPGKNVFPIKMDSCQIDQLLANLCVNARDAIADVGKVTIETTVAAIGEEYCADHPESIPGEYVILSVSDNGSGMDNNTKTHLFEPFFTTKELGKGTGLGLATVYGIVKQNNGFIYVYSEVCLGTTFKIYLPCYVGDADQHKNNDPDIPATSGDEAIIVVEDEPSILKMAKSMLEQQGYTVIATPKPSEAISISKESKMKIHLVITDVIMPEMNGRDLVKNLKLFNPELKSLFMSGYTANVIAHHGVLDDGVNFIQKPFSTKDLATKVRAVLDNQTK